MSLHIAASDIIITRTKLVLCIPKSAISPMSMHIAAFDMSQGQNWCCVFKKVQYRLSPCIWLHPIPVSQGQNWYCIFKKVQHRLNLCILLHPIYHKEKSGVVYSKRCNIA